MARSARRSRRALAIAALVVFGLAIAGCGDGGDSVKSTSTDGAQIWIDAGCGGCHTLAAAQSDGKSGPNLDEIDPTEVQVQDQVNNGGGGMPSFKGDLSPEQIAALAKYVSSSAQQ